MVLWKIFIISTVSSLILIKSLISQPFSHSSDKMPSQQGGQYLHRDGLEVMHLMMIVHVLGPERDCFFAVLLLPYLRASVKSIGGGVGKNEVVGVMLEANPMMTKMMMMTLTVPTDPNWQPWSWTVHWPWPSLMMGPIISQSYTTFLHSYWPYFHIFLLLCLLFSLYYISFIVTF